MPKLRPSLPDPIYSSDVTYPCADSLSESQFKQGAKLIEGVNGQHQINTNFNNTQVDSDALAPKSVLQQRYNEGEVPTGNAGDAKHWIRK